MISGYNTAGMAEPPGHWTLMLMRRLMVRGFIVTDFAARFGESTQALAGWMQEGRLKTRQDIRAGLARADEHVRLLYTGGNFGKLLVEVTPP
jgi:NADPH-dependent curcumin reductase CurA